MNFLLCSLSLTLMCYVSQTYGAGSLNSVCSNDDDCKLTDKAVCRLTNGCEKSGCVCPSDRTPNADKSACITNVPITKTLKKIGEVCSVITDCGDKATCLNNTKCACMKGYTQDSNNVDCISYSNGTKCNSTDVCGFAGTGDCSSGTCVCNDGYTWAAASGDISKPGACVANTAKINLGLKANCTYLWYSKSSPRVCGGDTLCGQCPENKDSLVYTCIGQINQLPGRAATATATLVTVAIAAVFSLLFIHLQIIN